MRVNGVSTPNSALVHSDPQPASVWFTLFSMLCARFCHSAACYILVHVAFKDSAALKDTANLRSRLAVTTMRVVVAFAAAGADVNGG